MLVGGGESTHLRPQPTALELIVRTVGMTRARVKIGLANLAYNFSRLTWLQAQTAAARGHRAGSPNIGYPRTSGAALDSSQNPCRRLPADHLLKTGFLEVSTRTKRWGYRSPCELRNQVVEKATQEAVGAPRRMHECTEAMDAVGSRPQPSQAVARSTSLDASAATDHP